MSKGIAFVSMENVSLEGMVRRYIHLRIDSAGLSGYQGEKPYAKESAIDLALVFGTEKSKS